MSDSRVTLMKGLLTIFLSALALTIQAQGNFFLKNYAPQQYHAHNQNWAVVQDARGIMYMGNAGGILEYDAVHWRLIPVRNQSRVNSLAISQEGRVYVGAAGEIGYLKADPQGKMQYFSLLESLPEKARSFADVWKTHVRGNEVFFHSVQSLIRFKNGKPTIWYPPQPATRTLSYLVGNELYVFYEKEGLFRIQGDALQPVKGAGFFASAEFIVSMLPWTEGRILVAQRSKGLLLYDPGSGNVIPFKPELTPFFESNLLFGGIKTAPDRWTLSTIRGGTVTLDGEGNIVHRLDSRSGLLSNNVRSLCLDQQQGLWLMLNEGIARAEVNAPLSFWNKTAGLAGTVYSLARYHGRIYAGTAEGLFFLSPGSGTFRRVEGVAHQCAQLMEHEGKLLVASAGGFFEVSDSTVTQHLEGRYTSLLMQGTHLITGSADGEVRIMRRSGNAWQRSITAKVASDELHSMAADASGNLWIGSRYSGIFFIRKTWLEKEPTEITPFLSRYDTASGLPAMNYNRVFSWKGNIYAATSQGFYLYDAAQNRWSPAPELKEAQNTRIYAVATDEKQQLWFESGKGKGIFDHSSEIFKPSLRRIPAPSEEINAICCEQGITWFGTAQGLFCYNQRVRPVSKLPFSTQIRSVGIADSMIFYGAYSQNDTSGKLLPEQPAHQVAKLEYRYNSLVFSYALPAYDQEENNQYSFYLEGYDKQWSEWTSETRKEYTNLPEGNYTFHVKARDIYRAEAPGAGYRFRILPPWFRTWWAYSGYVMLTLLLVGGAVLFNSRRLRQRNEHLERMIAERTRQVTQQKQVLENQKQALEEQKNEILVSNEELEQQAEEIMAQRDYITEKHQQLEAQKNELEKSYENIRILSSIGQKITSLLDVKEIIRTVYESVNQLMDAAAFGIGIYQEKSQRIAFEGFMEKGEELPLHYDSLENLSPSVWCLTRQQPIFINDFVNEYRPYFASEVETAAGEVPDSLIYLPLTIEDRRIGVITVQSFQKEAYSDYHLSLLQSLASYIAVGLDNAYAYQEIERKNHHITSSIRYAQTIQQAILPDMTKMRENFADLFVLYRPKDVVSGDFYWFCKSEEAVFIAVVDCTGHGVPGAFMSMIGNTLLNEIVNQKAIYSPARILEQLHTGIVESLRQSSQANADGMDICLCKISTLANGNRQVLFAGAKRPFAYLPAGEPQIVSIKGSRRSLGGEVFKDAVQFKEHVIELPERSVIYLFTDGITDQSNPERSRLGWSPIAQVLERHAHLPLHEQQKAVEELLNGYQQYAEQRDDITLLGLRI